MRTLPEIIADLDTVLKTCIKEKYGISDIIITLAALTEEPKDYADANAVGYIMGRFGIDITSVIKERKKKAVGEKE